VIKAQIDLVSSWMSLGFIHGVMNTDNMSISGETIDYGPCAFMDYFDYQQVYSFIDRQGRYSFINQPQALAWNLARLSDALIVIVKDNFNINEESAIQLLGKELILIKEQFESSFIDKIYLKLALDGVSILEEEKRNLISQFLETLQAKKLDFTLSFRTLSEGLMNNNLTGDLSTFFTKWCNILKSNKLDFQETANKMNSINPIYIPRNHLVEKAIEEAIGSDYSLFNLMNEIFKNPFEDQLRFQVYSLPPRSDEVVGNTFCGT
jgi:uncharacterized protein YdiU (UPF0061 family)